MTTSDWILIKDALQEKMVRSNDEAIDSQKSQQNTKE